MASLSLTINDYHTMIEWSFLGSTKKTPSIVLSLTFVSLSCRNFSGFVKNCVELKFLPKVAQKCWH